MTSKEMETKSQEKVAKIKTLAKELQVQITAEEIISGEGIIKKVVFYTDIENYPSDEPKLEEIPPKSIEESNENTPIQ